jgi:hypothetical protein
VTVLDVDGAAVRLLSLVGGECKGGNCKGKGLEEGC